MKTITLDAAIENIEKVTAFVEEQLELAGASMKVTIQLDTAIDEIFCNIASYAYAPGRGEATVVFDIKEDPRRVSLTFIDEGIPFDPLEKADPDVSLSLDERQIGGLGIFMVKKSMDNVFYEYKDNKNIFTIEKNL